MLLPVQLHVPANTTTLRQFCPIYTGFLFLSALNSGFYCSLSGLYTNSPPPTFKICQLATRHSPSRTLQTSSTLRPKRLNPVKCYLKCYGSTALAFSAPDLRNSLHDNICSCDNLNTFKSKLKTYLFKNAYHSW